MRFYIALEPAEMFSVLTRKMMPKSHGLEEKVWFREEQHFLHDSFKRKRCACRIEDMAEN